MAGEALRQQLIGSIADSLAWRISDRKAALITAAAIVVEDVDPFVAAARVATATEIAEAIEAEFRRDRSMTPFAVEHGISIVRAALARWSVPAPKGDQ